MIARVGSCVLASLALAACAGSSPPPTGTPTPIGQSQSGIITYYNATGGGACSFDPSPSDLMVAAMNMPQFAGSAVCGSCVKVTGPLGEVTVRIVDLCPECQSGHLDMSQQAFERIARREDGRVNVTWQTVSCAVSGPIAYHFKEGSNQWWSAVQIRNHKLPVTKLEAMKNGAWVELTRSSYNYFLYESGLGPGPYTFRVTAQDGQQLTDSNIVFQEAGTSPGAAQFQ